LATKKQAGGRLLAIGDIHGCADELDAMVKAIAPAAGDTLIFVGDYVDRGPASREVIEQLIDLQRGPAEVVFLKGNHEDMMLGFMGFPGRYGESFMFNGGLQTLASYGISDPEVNDAIQRIPSSHQQFLKGLRESYLRPPYLFVHAGILPGVPFDEQNPEDLLWIRHEFIFNPHQLGVTVVFGHTPLRAVMCDLPYKIGIDTGLVYGGKLTCIEFGEGTLYQVSRGSRRVNRQALALA
jgi:diadenosine tetraphosphatase ApaH/serine/threonine PP2A family protein phosphatase